MHDGHNPFRCLPAIIDTGAELSKLGELNSSQAPPPPFKMLIGSGGRVKVTGALKVPIVRTRRNSFDHHYTPLMILMDCLRISLIISISTTKETL